MCENSDTNESLSYTITEVPLTQDDINKLHKILSSCYQMNFLLLPLLICIFFWGVLYFGIFLVFVIICNGVFTNNYFATAHGLTQSKIVVTGVVTSVWNSEEMNINFGSEKFDITYANVKFLIKINDKVAIHYSKKEDNSRKHILNVEMAN